MLVFPVYGYFSNENYLEFDLAEKERLKFPGFISLFYVKNSVRKNYIIFDHLHDYKK